MCCFVVPCRCNCSCIVPIFSSVFGIRHSICIRHSVCIYYFVMFHCSFLILMTQKRRADSLCDMRVLSLLSDWATEEKISDPNATKPGDWDEEVPYCTVLCYAVLYCTVLSCTVPPCTALHCTALYCTELCCAVLYCIVLSCSVQYYSALHCTELYCII